MVANKARIEIDLFRLVHTQSRDVVFPNNQQKAHNQIAVVVNCEIVQAWCKSFVTLSVNSIVS